MRPRICAAYGDGRHISGVRVAGDRYDYTVNPHHHLGGRPPSVYEPNLRSQSNATFRSKNQVESSSVR